MDRARALTPSVADRTARPSAAAVTVAILLYVALLFALRLWLSPFLEIDEAQFVGAVDLRLVYANSHPPLYNWLVRGALEATAWNWALAVALVKALLLGATYLLLFDAARRLAGTEGGILALAGAALLPQVSWMAAHTLAHSVLVMAAAAGVVHALVLVATRPSATAFLALGILAGVGMMAKFNAALLLAPLAVAVLTDPLMRSRFATARALLAPAAFTAVAAPGILGILLAPAEQTERVVKLYRDGPFAALDVPEIGVDGVLSLAVATLAWGGIVLGLVALFGRRPPDLGAAAGSVRRVFWRTIAIGLAASAIAVLATDVSVVAERYLTPLLMPLPVLAALHLLGWRRRGLVIAAGAAVFAAVPLGIVGMTALDDHRFARPYPAIAAAVGELVPAGPMAVDSWRQSLAANVVIALRREGREAAILGDPLAAPAPVLVRVRPGTGPLPADEWPVPPGVCHRASLQRAFPLLNLTGRAMPVTVDVFEAAPCKR